MKVSKLQQYISRNWVAGIALASVVFTGCAKNLEQGPQATATKDAIFGTVDGLKLYSFSFYDGLPGIGDPFRTDGLADYSVINAVNDFIRENAYTPRTATGWDWKQLRNINYFIANNNNPKVPEATRNNYQALARFFRAYFYFEKVKRYGNVPWVGKPLGINDQELYVKQSPRALVVDSIIADLNYATANLQLTADGSASQITKNVAYGLLSRVCLFEGTWRRYQKNDKPGADSLLRKAADAAKVVMDSKAFSLNQSGGTSSSYRQLFISPKPVNAEVMLSVVADPALSVMNDANWWYTSTTYGLRLSLSRTFVNTYLNVDGTPFTNIDRYDTLPFIKETQNRDLRLKQTIRTPGYTRISNGKVVAPSSTFTYSYNGYMPIKWTLDDVVYDGGGTNNNSICVMRYAEILLNYAEARAELNELTDADWSATVGALRARAGITGGIAAKPIVLDQYMANNYFGDVKDASLMEIRRERGIELVLEGFRFSDLIRWKHGELMMQSWNGIYVRALDEPMDLTGDGIPDVCFYKTAPANPIAGVTYINVAAKLGDKDNPQRLSHDTYGEVRWLDNIKKDWQDYKYLYPIPYTELLLNTQLDQNPIWDTK
ncbi:RagB/SusD family nutrient uptake outer membrane protein [Chitinophaga silvatica]|uniref:RagB/SusD family nutrient uptake outer membrane protein n=1 Tax=Chitinophaga silvatica TaxID=2282649 RepID=A0A3E1Y4R5_9BACT|nr:RagB/SusD family nutrient uptake outer membrane protein [Chitinophaga silvatica]RFS19653.1 RagB/SusD family nutrient uptake outer membrane protein [Chitinophaga silvatica]